MLNFKKPYVPVVVLSVVAAIVALLTFRQYGMSWDEQLQRGPGLLSYNYIFHGDDTLFNTISDNHGAGFELLLIIIEKALRLSLPADIYHMRHLVSHLVFLAGALSLSLLSLSVTKSRFLSCVCFLMLLCMPRIYAHSFFNSKDVPFLAITAMALAVARPAFAGRGAWLFAALGLLCGYATSIRIMGLLMGCVIVVFLVADMIFDRHEQKKVRVTLRNALVFSLSFCVAVYISWPYLWRTPLHTFAESFALMSKYDWGAKVLLAGQFIDGNKLPWTYFPIWFSITTPLLWLICGCCGVIIFVLGFIRNPLKYLKNGPDRDQLLYLACFAGPVFAVVFFHSVIYDDWRHLYFVYPPFVMCGIYFLGRVYTSRYKNMVRAACVGQVLITGWFMVNHISFNQVYFNSLVSHKKEYLRYNYELDYWGAGYIKALRYLANMQTDSVMTISSSTMNIVLENNMLLLDKEEAARLKITSERDSCNYLITNFRQHPQDFPHARIEYSVTVLNSTVLRVYRVR